VNREFKRQMRREQRAEERAMARGQRAPVPVQQQKRERTGIRQYIREIRSELKRVMWPSRGEVVKYSTVVIFVVAALTGVVFLLDLGFGQVIVELFRPVGR
jgi:preprotein translocase subunit SecE